MTEFIKYATFKMVQRCPPAKIGAKGAAERLGRKVTDPDLSGSVFLCQFPRYVKNSIDKLTYKVYGNGVEAIQEVKRTLYTCLRCGHQWFARNKNKSTWYSFPEYVMQPKICPKCKSRFWNLPRKKRELT